MPLHVSLVQREPCEQPSQELNPKVLFITCSDLPVTPHLLSRVGSGDIFMLRNAGNLVPSYKTVRGGEAATIEYAIRILQVTHVIVCGHSHCGAMTSLMHLDETEHLSALKIWLVQAQSTKTLIQKEFGHLKGESLVAKAIGENACVQLQNLHTHPTVAERLSLGAVILHGWVYHTEGGDLWFCDFKENRFLH